MKKFMETTNQNKRAILKDWKFWFQLAIAILIFAAILTDYIDRMVNISDLVGDNKNSIWEVNSFDKDGKALVGYDYAGFTFYYFTYFTTQSNIFVAVWCLISVIRFNKKSITDNDLLTYAVATYITITMIIYQTMLFPTSFGKNADGVMILSLWGFENWFSQEILHLIAPIMFIVFVVRFRESHSLISTKTLLTKKIWVSFTYPLVWGIGELIRGEFYYRSNRPVGTQYHYFFMNVHQNGGDNGYPVESLAMPGVVWFLIAILFILAISIGFFTLYNFVINKRESKQKNVIV